MPGTNAGTGHPIRLRCYWCRKQAIYLYGRPRGFRLEATGRRKPLPENRGRGYRRADELIEIRCLDCGRKGWTKHIDAEALLKQWQRNPRRLPA